MRFKILVASITTFLVVVSGSGIAHSSANRKPIVTAFDVPAYSTSPVTINTIEASDPDGTVVYYLVTETSTTPSANDPKWSTTKPSSFETVLAGTVTLYAWAKDGLGAISTSKSDAVTISATLPADKCMATVAKSGGDYTNIQEAINSFSGLGVNKRCLVKIMPGIYETPIVMREFVDIQGSGQENTEIRSSIGIGAVMGDVTPMPGQAQATVEMASHSALRDLTVTNNSDVGAIAVYGYNVVDVKAERIRAIASGTGGGSNGYAGFYIGNISSVVLDEVYAESSSGTPDSGDSGAIVAYSGPHLEVIRSRLVVQNAWYNVGIAFSEGGSGIPGTDELIVRDSVVESLGNTVQSIGILVGGTGTKATIHGTSVNVDCGQADSYCFGVSGTGSSLHIDHSDITTANCDMTGQKIHTVLHGNGIDAKIASTGLLGQILWDRVGVGTRIVSSWDTNLNALNCTAPNCTAP